MKEVEGWCIPTLRTMFSPTVFSDLMNCLYWGEDMAHLNDLVSLSLVGVLASGGCFFISLQYCQKRQTGECPYLFSFFFLNNCNYTYFPFREIESTGPHRNDLAPVPGSSRYPFTRWAWTVAISYRFIVEMSTDVCLHDEFS
jgi:hypothetical protein